MIIKPNIIWQKVGTKPSDGQNERQNTCKKNRVIDIGNHSCGKIDKAMINGHNNQDPKEYRKKMLIIRVE